MSEMEARAGGRRVGAPRSWLLSAFALSAATAALALGNQALARWAERRHPPRGRFIEVDGVRLHYLEAGEGPPVLLLHGNAVTAEDFVASGLFDHLARTSRVIAFDRPGYGYSARPRGRIWTAQAQARLFLAAMQKLDARPALVLGHSWGAFVAAEMALAAPSAVTGVVLASGYYRPTPRLDTLLAVSGAMPGLGDFLSHTISPVSARLTMPLMLRLIFAPEPVSEGVRHAVQLSFRPGQLRASAVEAALLWSQAARLRWRLPRLRPPTLILCGEDDKLINAAHQSRWLADRLPRAQFVSLPGEGHMAHYAPQGAAAAAIEGFIRQVDAVHPAAGFAEVSDARFQPA